ncbi:MAG: addiction module toxin RelE [Chloroflexi bacterium]|nr:addiction module toxin RelE [Chloroflexota bacterium]
MPWEVEYTDEFLEWWNGISGRDQDSVSKSVDRLIEDGISLDFPHSSAIHSSRHSHMRELRVQGGRSSIRVFYAFDPRRTSILLIGGAKTDGDRFYRQYVPIADRLYDRYLEELRQEGLIP